MAWNLYSETRDDLKYVADVLEEHEFSYKIYNQGVLYNAEDRSGVIQSFYPTTGTIVFHRSNDKKDHALYTIRNSDLETFMGYLNNPTQIQDLFNIKG